MGEGSNGTTNDGASMGEGDSGRGRGRRRGCVGAMIDQWGRGKCKERCSIDGLCGDDGRPVREGTVQRHRGEGPIDRGQVKGRW